MKKLALLTAFMLFSLFMYSNDFKENREMESIFINIKMHEDSILKTPGFYSGGSKDAVMNLLHNMDCNPDLFFDYLSSKLAAGRLTYSELSPVYLQEFMDDRHFQLFDRRSQLFDRKDYKKNNLLEYANHFFEPEDNIELKNDAGDIYAYEKAFEATIDDNNKIVFYSSKIFGDRNDNVFAVMRWDQRVRLAHAYMDMVSIYGKQLSLYDFINNEQLKGAGLITPDACMSTDDDLYISYSYANSSLQGIAYSKPTYKIIGGQPFPLFSGGVTPVYGCEWVSCLSKIEKNSITSCKTVSLPGIKEPQFLYSDNFLYVYEWETSKNCPWYVLDYDLNVVYEISPEEGDEYDDIIETPDYIILCGRTRNNGYVGYDNPLLLIIDKNNIDKPIRKVYAEKNCCFNEMRMLNDDEMLVYAEASLRSSYVFTPRIDKYRIIKLSSIIPEGSLPEHIKQFSKLHSAIVIEKCSQSGNYIFRDPSSYKYGLLSSDKDNIIKEATYDNYIITPHHIEVYLNGKKGILDYMGEELIQCGQYDSIEFNTNAEVFIVRDSSGKAGMLDKKGNMICMPKYQDIFQINDGWWKNLFQVKGAVGYYGLINSKGEEIAEPIYKRLEFNRDDPYRIIITDCNNNVGLLTTDGQIVATPKYKEMEATNGGYIVKDQFDRFGLIDPQIGNIIIEPMYKSIQYVGDFIVKNDADKYGVIDGSGKVLVELRFRRIEQVYADLYEEDFLVQNEGGKYGFIHLGVDGRTEIDQKYTDLVGFDIYGYLLASKGKQYGIIDYSGNTIVPFKYKIDITADYIVLVNIEGKHIIQTVDKDSFDRLADLYTEAIDPDQFLKDNTYTVLKNNR